MASHKQHRIGSPHLEDKRTPFPNQRTQSAQLLGSAKVSARVHMSFANCNIWMTLHDPMTIMNIQARENEMEFRSHAWNG